MKISKNLAYILLSCSIGLLGLSGCGSDSDTATTAVVVQTGYLYDDQVGGLEYSTATQSGVTGTDGSFKYLVGEKVTFKIGNLTIGKATTANSALTLFDIASTAQNSDGSPSSEVVAMATLLQSLDSDKDPNNGISISQATRDAFAKLSTQTLSATSDVKKIINTDANLTTVSIKSASTATDHLITSTAKIVGATTFAKQTFSGKNITEITKYTVDTSAYDLNHSLSAISSKLPLAVGSGLRLKSNSNGSMVFYGLTDRGPNGDAPLSVTDASGAKYSASKTFPLPDFVPTIAEITVKDGKATVTKTIPLKASASASMSGLPLPSGQTGSTNEIALNDALSASLGFSANGIDPEGIDIDSSGNLWICDEYGPFIAKVNPTTGVIEKKFIPGDATNPLPDIIKNRVPNRGMEGLAIAPDTGYVYGLVQTPLDSDGNGSGDDSYMTLVELNPTTGVVNLYAVTFDKYDATTNPSGFSSSGVKAGDLMALGGGKFLMIEQGKNGKKTLVNNLVLINISGATKITSADYAGKTKLAGITVGGAAIVPSTRTLIVNLRDFGWLPEKAEGLTKIDDQTIAIINDSDFGISASASCKVSGVETTLDATALSVNLAAKTVTTSEKSCDSGTIKYSVTSNAEEERRTRLWVIKLSKPISSY